MVFYTDWRRNRHRINHVPLFQGVASGNTGGGEAWTRRGVGEGVNDDTRITSVDDDEHAVIPTARQTLHEQV